MNHCAEEINFLYNGHCPVCHQREVFINCDNKDDKIGSDIFNVKKRGYRREAIVCAAVRKLIKEKLVRGFEHHDSNSVLDKRGSDITLLLPNGKVLYCQVKKDEDEARRFYRCLVNGENEQGAYHRVDSSATVILMIRSVKEGMEKVAEDLRCFIQQKFGSASCRSCRKEKCFCFRPDRELKRANYIYKKSFLKHLRYY